MSAFVPGAAALALLGERGVEPGAIDAHAVLGRELDRQVDREAVRVVELERDVAREDRRIGGQVLGLARDLAVGRGQRDERLLEEVVPASSVRPNATSSRVIPPRIEASFSRRCG